MLRYLFLTALLWGHGMFAAEGTTATFAGGCFWCMEHAFDHVPGVISTSVGYTGGSEPNPTYKQVSSGSTGHVESVQVVFDSAKVTYAELLETFWRNIDPTVKDRQFCDVGRQYRSAIFYHDSEQERLAKASKEALSDRFPLIHTEIESASTFYQAEKYHQKYYKKNPVRYRFYRYTCGRLQRLEEIWD